MSTRRALFYSFLDRYSGLVLAVISSMVIARLLRPDEIGVFSVAMAMLGFSATLRDMGVGQYVVQAKSFEYEELKTVWTIQFGLGTALAIVVALLAYPASSFYNEPRLAPVMGVMALTYLTTPIGSITYALLMREMRFEHVAVMRFTSGLIGAVVCITLAYRGEGPISLAWGQLAASCVTALTAQIYRQKNQPWGFSLAGARAVLGFGGRITGVSFTNTFVQAAPDFLLGKLQGMTIVGLYSRSNGLVAMFARLLIDASYNVTVAHFAKSIREGRNPVPDFLLALRYLVTLNVGFAIGLAILADPITSALYGDQWGDSVELTRWLSLAAVFMGAQSACGSMIAGHGRPDMLLRATIFSGFVTILSITIGASGDLRSVGISLAISSLVSTAIWFFVAHKVCAYPIEEALRVSASSALIACLGCTPLPFLWWILQASTLHPLLTLGACISTTFIFFMVTMILMRHPIGENLRTILTSLFRSRSTTS